jgi:hypothetical protein
MSWEEIRSVPESVIPEMSEKDKVIQRLIVDVFHGTQDGRDLLDKLLSKYLYASVCPPNQNAAYGYYREGQNSILLGIKLIIDAYKNRNNT